MSEFIGNGKAEGRGRFARVLLATSLVIFPGPDAISGRLTPQPQAVMPDGPEIPDISKSRNQRKNSGRKRP